MSRYDSSPGKIEKINALQFPIDNKGMNSVLAFFSNKLVQYSSSATGAQCCGDPQGMSPHYVMTNNK